MTPSRVGELGLAEALGDWSSGPGPLYTLLATALRDAIDRGDFRPGVVLPAERSMGRVLAVSRTTVVAALEMLKRIGYLDSRPGSGTWVRPVREFELAGGVTAPAAGIGRNPLFRNLGNTDSNLVDLTAAALSPSPMINEILEDAFRLLVGQLQGPGYFPLGLPGLRRAVAERFTQRGLPTTSDEVMITSGGQQGIMILAAAYIQPGDPVLVESPTYPGAIEAFRLLGGRTHTVAVGPDGLIAQDVIRQVEAKPPSLIYLIPSFHNPTGSVMPDVERKRLRRYLSGRGIPVVEDESLVELPLDGDEAPPPLGVEPESGTPILIVGSASKPFWGGLRIGWIRAPAEVIEMISRHKLVFDLATPIPNQVAAEQLLARSELILPERRRELHANRRMLLDLLAGHLPEWSVIPPSGGVTAWVRVGGRSATEVSQLALRHGVAVVASPFFDGNGSLDSHVRIPFVSDTDTMHRGIERLAHSWNLAQPAR